ncbi:glycosyltransferase family 39 protein [Albidovulum sp.]|uniref:glycosyltransferase family 39 protein n=1 Tax=Albidovulum sp. TaxID=1872424 RepID=UPI0039B917B0
MAKADALPARLWTGIAVAAVLLALVLRLYGLDLRSISHPEVYVPGIPLPLEHSVPPPRLTWADTLWMHYHDEPHPMGWYLAMFAWTKVTGISEWALRLPGAVIGAASVWLVFLLGRRVFGSAAGALAAVLLALHGFHVFWSQAARMYVPGAFLGLLSTLLLLAFVYDGRRRMLTGAGYVLSVAATATCVEFVWPLLGIQILWATLVLPARGDFRWSDVLRARMAGMHPAILLQMLAVMISAPELLHSVYRARAGAVEQTGLAFLREYLSFGFLFVTDPDAIPPMALSAPVAAALLVAVLGLVAGGIRAPARAPRPAPAGAALPGWLPVAVAAAAAAVMVWLALIALHRNAALLVVAAGPVLALWLPALSRAADHVLSRSVALTRWREATAGPRLLAVLVGVAAPLILFVLSAKVEILANRAFLLFVPALLVLVAGAVTAIPLSWPRHVVAAALIGLFAASLPWSFARPGSPRDHKALVAGMQASYRPDDLVFVLDKRWEEAPLFYYLPAARFVFGDYAEALRRDPQARVWLVTWPWEDMPVITDERREALAGYARVDHVEALRASAELFVPPGNP